MYFKAFTDATVVGSNIPLITNVTSKIQFLILEWHLCFLINIPINMPKLVETIIKQKRL